MQGKFAGKTLAEQENFSRLIFKDHVNIGDIMKPVSIIVLVLFVIGCFVAIVLAGTNPRYIPEQQLAVMWLRQAAGTFIAVVATLAILVRCLNGNRIDDLMGLLVALLAGLAVAAADWALTIPLGLIIIGYLVKEIIELVHAKSTSKAETQ